MAFLCKCGSADIEAIDDATMRISIRAPHSPAIPPQDTVFVWVAETSGGGGLYARGVLQSGQTEAGRYLLQLRLVDAIPLLPLSNDLLRRVEVKHPHLRANPDQHDGSALFTLWRKLYYFSLNRVITLSPDEHALVQAAFCSSS